MTAVQPLPNPEIPEEGVIPEEAMEAEEMPTQEQTGFLPTPEGKYHSFVPQEPTPFSEKCADQLQQPKEKEVAKQEKPPIKERKFTVLSQSKRGHETPARTATTAHQTLQQAAKPLARHATPLQVYSERKAEKQGEQQKQARSEGRVKQEKRSAENSRQPQKGAEGTRSQQYSGHAASSQAREEQRAEEQRRRDEEEGFAEDERREQEQEQPEYESEGCKVGAVEQNPVLAYGASESTLSEIFKMRISQFDVLLLFFEVMKLALKGKEQERIARARERELQLEHMQQEISNMKRAATQMRSASIGAGVLGIAAGVLPLAGHFKGGWLLDNVLGRVIKSLRGLDAKEQSKMFNRFAEMAQKMSEMQKSFGDVQRTFSESSTIEHRHLGEMHKTDESESTRVMEELRDEWKSIEQFLHQSLQMQHDATRQLYS